MPSQKRVEKAQALAEKVLDLAIDESTLTVEELAQRLGISRATFFRHFGSKEQAILMAVSGPAAQMRVALLEAGPLAENDSVWPLLRRAFEPVLLRAEVDLERYRQRVLLLRNVPEMRAGASQARLSRILELATGLEALGMEGFKARMFASAAIAIFDNSISIWAQSDQGEPLRISVDQAFETIEKGR